MEYFPESLARVLAHLEQWEIYCCMDCVFFRMCTIVVFAWRIESTCDNCVYGVKILIASAKKNLSAPADIPFIHYVYCTFRNEKTEEISAYSFPWMQTSRGILKASWTTCRQSSSVSSSILLTYIWNLLVPEKSFMSWVRRRNVKECHRDDILRVVLAISASPLFCNNRKTAQIYPNNTNN